MVKIGSEIRYTTPVPRKKKETLTTLEKKFFTKLFTAYTKQYKTKSPINHDMCVILEEKLIRMKVLNPKSKFVPKIHDLGFISDVQIVGVEQPDGSFTQMTKEEWEREKN